MHLHIFLLSYVLGSLNGYFSLAAICIQSRSWNKGENANKTESILLKWRKSRKFTAFHSDLILGHPYMTSQNCHLQSFGPILAINNILIIYRLFQKRHLTISSTSISFTLLGLNKLLKLVEIQTCVKYIFSVWDQDYWNLILTMELINHEPHFTFFHNWIRMFLFCFSIYGSLTNIILTLNTYMLLIFLVFFNKYLCCWI